MNQSPTREALRLAAPRRAGSGAPARAWHPRRAPPAPGSARPSRRRGSGDRRSPPARRRPTASAEDASSAAHSSSCVRMPESAVVRAVSTSTATQTSAAPLRSTSSWPAASSPAARSRICWTSMTGLRRTTFIGLTNDRDASGPQYAAAHRPAAPASSAAPLIAPVDAPTTRSKQGVSPSRSSAALIPAETTPRMPPPSSTSATRWGSCRAPGRVPARRRSRSTAATGCVPPGIARDRSEGWPAPHRGRSASPAPRGHGSPTHGTPPPRAPPPPAWG